MRTIVAFLFLALWANVRAPAPGSNDPYAMADIAVDLLERGDLEAAVVALERALHAGQSVFAPRERALVLTNLASAHERAGRTIKALEIYRTAARLAPELEDTWMKAALCASALGSPQEAAEFLKGAVDAGGSSKPHILHEYGVVLNNIQRFEDAAAAHRQGLFALVQSVTARAGGSAVQQQQQQQQQQHLPPGSPPPPLRALLDSPRAARELGSKLFSGLGIALSNGRVGDGSALSAFSAALALAPASLDRLSSLWFARAEECRWVDWGSMRRRLIRALNESLPPESERSEDRVRAAVCGRGEVGAAPVLPPSSSASAISTSPYQAMSLEMPGQLRKRISRSWAAVQAMQGRQSALAAAASAAATAGTSPPLPRARDELLPATAAVPRLSPDGFRLAYISRRFKHYAGAHLLLGMFRRHFRAGGNASLACVATGPDDGSETRRQVCGNACCCSLDAPLGS
jgi:tetratricopeptide (TPR) repeat protein